MHPKLRNQVTSSGHFGIQNFGKLFCWKLIQVGFYDVAKFRFVNSRLIFSRMRISHLTRLEKVTWFHSFVNCLLALWYKPNYFLILGYTFVCYWLINIESTNESSVPPDGTQCIFRIKNHFKFWFKSIEIRIYSGLW